MGLRGSSDDMNKLTLQGWGSNQAKFMAEALKYQVEETALSVREGLPENSGFAPGIRTGDHGVDDRAELSNGK